MDSDPNHKKQYQITKNSDIIDFGRNHKNEFSAPKSVRELTLTRERSRTEINGFLDSIKADHLLGPTQGWKAAFGARYNGALIAVCVLSRPVSRFEDNGETISISRLASIPKRPDNTGSWLIARARKWAFLEGYKKVIAYSGVDGNPGTVYKAAGFELVSKDTAIGSGWTNRENRKEWEDYTRIKWRYCF